jgi:epoxyqueuosine reductase
MKAAICERALALGFDDCRVTTAQPPQSARQFEQWLASKQHGEMGYLERNAHKRIDPEQVLAGARSIITLAVSYAAEDRGASGQGRGATNQHSGVVARYARYTDYHRVIGERLKLLADFVVQLGGQATRALWYVDTGPLPSAPDWGLSASTPTSSTESLAIGFSSPKSSRRSN